MRSRISSFFWLLALSSSMFGVQYVFSIQFAVGSPLFAEQLKLSNSAVSIILGTSGPICGLLVQPIAGVFSDSCRSKYGRRRPYIIIGTSGACIGMALLGGAVKLGNFFGDDKNGIYPSSHIIGLILAVTGLWMLNITLNIFYVAGRAIIGDLVPSNQQHQANALVTCNMGLGAIVANFVGSQFLLAPNPYEKLFLMGVIFVFVSVIPTVYYGKETMVTDVPKKSVKEVFSTIFYGYKQMPRDIIKLSAVYFISWCAYAPLMVYITVFFAENVYHGDRNLTPDLYQKGIKIGMYALGCFAILQTFFSLSMTKVLNFVGVKPTYVISQILSTFCFFVIFFFDTPWVAVLFTALVGINFTAMMSIPFALLVDILDGQDPGMYMGILNSFNSYAQVIAILLGGQAAHIEGENVAYSIALGGCFSFFAIPLSYILLPTSSSSSSSPSKKNIDEEKPLLD